MNGHECKYEASIAEMKTDIKWLVSDSKRRNGIMEEHVRESDSFREQVKENSKLRTTLHWVTKATVSISIVLLMKELIFFLMGK